MADEKTYTTTKDQITDGAILKSYGKKSFVSVVPSPSIDKVKWSIVKIGSKGKDHIDYYLSIEEMRKFCEEIENGEAGKKLSKDMESQYPSAYKFTTGVDGCKHLNIGGGRKGIRIQIQNGKSQDMTVASWNDMKEMGFLFKLTMGLIPCMGGTYYHSLIKAFYQGEANRAAYFQKDYNEAEDGRYTPQDSEETQNSNPAEQSKASESASSPAAEKSADQSKPDNSALYNMGVGRQSQETTATETPKEEATNTAKVTSMELKVKTPLTDIRSGGKAFQGWASDNKVYNVIISKEMLGNVQALLDKAKVAGTKLEVKGAVKDDRIYVAS